MSRHIINNQTLMQLNEIVLIINLLICPLCTATPLAPMVPTMPGNNHVALQHYYIV